MAVPKMGASLIAEGRGCSQPRQDSVGLLLLAAVLLLGCEVSPDRQACEIDVDCPDEQVCYEDSRCLPTDVARQLGASVGDECTHSAGTVRGCDFTCLMAFCDGPPEFDGAETAISGGPTTLTVTWKAPGDETHPDDLLYRVYVSATSGAQDFTAPTLMFTGGTSVELEGLTVDTPYYIVVRVEDGFGQREENTHEVRGVPGCIEYETQIAPMIARRCVECHGEERAERGLRLDSLESLRAGAPSRPLVVGCRSDQSRIVQRAGEPPAADTRGPHGGLSEEELELLRAWIDEGGQDTCPADRALCADEVAPTFAGATGASATGSSTAELCWAAGSDDRTSQAELVYDVHVSPAGPGALPVATSEAGDTCVTLSGLVPGGEHCFTVRARDGAGNADTNAVETCVTMPDVDCIEYADVIQPLFDARCIHCHAGERPRLRTNLTSYESAMEGGGSGALVTACNPDESTLLSRLGTTPPRDIRMPADGPPYLTDTQIDAVRRWIEEGARASCEEPDPC